eukprot:CAMPEP_0113579856 /NCGR_PEP_ID=MMETSP0015_2-20120614/30317_1 /TAXON_ID=2838 /ORGANISM="Odontella" /LENGTH=96 /DNA_ID=CAMNT_0000483915 /DNA_START=140 /DNA_END=430 /DNA_ORIENTATION=- /assembly_acc=CAM_ASM_000160
MMGSSPDDLCHVPWVVKVSLTIDTIHRIDPTKLHPIPSPMGPDTVPCPRSGDTPVNQYATPVVFDCYNGTNVRRRVLLNDTKVVDLADDDGRVLDI